MLSIQDKSFNDLISSTIFKDLDSFLDTFIIEKIEKNHHVKAPSPSPIIAKVISERRFRRRIPYERRAQCDTLLRVRNLPIQITNDQVISSFFNGF